MAEYAREEINSIGGYYAYGKELVNGSSIFDYDVTKLSVYTRDIGLTGIEVYDLLRDEYDIQIEFGDIGNILAYISIGDRIQDIERLVGALEDIKRLYSKPELEAAQCGIHHARSWRLRRRRRFIPRRSLSPYVRPQAVSAASSSCAIPRAYRSSHPERWSRRRS